MADLGAIGHDVSCVRHDIVGPRYFNYLATGYSGGVTAQNGVLSGSVFDGANPVANARVVILIAATLDPVARTYTDASGNWSVSGLCPDMGAIYAAIAQDPVTGTVYNDLIYTGLTAVVP